ncbi:hypothetical protein FQN54_009436 [Arachnomyces sp. PD_36]|nr:hypothetical protein FQN54_009436 [Arachnomyces sp. PD_36]
MSVEQESIPTTMRAIHLPPNTQTPSPSPSSLIYTPAYPTPTPSPTQYLLQTTTTTLSPNELTHTTLPFKTHIPAHSICGTIISTPSADYNRPDGPTFKIGDEVFGLVGLDAEGGAADYVVVEEGEVGFKPRNVTAAEAGVVPLGGLMGWQALEGAGLRSSLIEEVEGEGEGEGDGGGEGEGAKGEMIRVLVMGALSEVGRYVVQLLRSNTAPFDGGIRRKGKGMGRKKGKLVDKREIFWICATGSASIMEDGDEKYLRDELGADEVVSLESQGDDDGGSKLLSQTFTGRGWDPVDVVLDCEDTSTDSDVAASLACSPHVVRRDGGWEVLKLNLPTWTVEMVDVVDCSSKNDGGIKAKRWSFTVQPNSVQLSEIAEVVENGEMAPMVDREFGLYEAKEAMEWADRSSGKKFRGKVVLRVNS